MQFGPLYLHRVLGFDLSRSGVAAAIPPLICIFVKFFAGPVSDGLPWLSARARIILFASISQVRFNTALIQDPVAQTSELSFVQRVTLVLGRDGERRVASCWLALMTLQSLCSVMLALLEREFHLKIELPRLADSSWRRVLRPMSIVSDLIDETADHSYVNCSTGAIVFSGVNCVGLFKGVQLMSGRYSYVILSLFGLTNSIIVLGEQVVWGSELDAGCRCLTNSNDCIIAALPGIAAVLTPDHTRGQVDNA